MVIIFTKKTSYKSKHHSISFPQIFQTKNYYLHLTTSIKKSAVGQNKQNFQYDFHASQAIKYVIKPGQNSLSAASLIIFFDFQDTQLFKILALIEIIHTSLFIFVCSPLFFGKRKFSTIQRSHYALLSIHKHGAFSRYSQPIFSQPIRFLF